MAKNLPITEFDMTTINPTMQILKAMIPFFDFSTQKMFSFYIRINELQQTIKFYSQPRNASVFASCNCEPRQPVRSFNDILENAQLVDAVLKYCPDSLAQNINMIRQFSKMSDLMNIFNSMNQDSGGMDFSKFNFGNMDFGNMDFSNMNLGNMNFSDTNLGNMNFNNMNFNNMNSQNKNFTNYETNNFNTDNSNTTKSASDNSSSMNRNFDTSNFGNMANIISNMLNPANNSFMNTEQQKLYDEYLKELDKLDFNVE